MASAQSKSCGHHCCILMLYGPSLAPTVTEQWQECPKDTQKCAGKQQGADGICDSFRLHSQLMAAEPCAKSAWHVTDITGYFSCSHWTLGEVTDIYGLWGLDCIPLTPKGMTGHYQKQDLDAMSLGDALKRRYKKTHLAKESAAVGRAVRHVLMTKEREIPPKYPIKTPSVSLTWSQVLLQTDIQPWNQKNIYMVLMWLSAM